MYSQHTGASQKLRKKKSTRATVSPVPAPTSTPAAPPPPAARKDEVVARINGNKVALGPTGKLQVRYADLLHGLHGHVLKYRSGPSGALRGTVLVPDAEGNVGIIPGSYTVVDLLADKRKGSADTGAKVEGVVKKEERAKRVSGYNLFMSSHRKTASGTVRPLGEVGAEWTALPAEDKKEWNTKAEAMGAKVKAEQSEPASQAPPAKRRKAEKKEKKSQTQ